MANINVLNLTPHSLNLLGVDGVTVTIHSSGVARVSSTSTVIDTVAGFSVTRTVFGDVVGLPDHVDGVIYVVSTLVLSALAGSRTDVYGPGPLLRDAGGNVVGANGLAVL